MAAARGIPRVEVSPTGFLLAGLVGAWAAHNLEYLRVWGTSVFPSAVSRSAHVYMAPAGIFLVLGALAAVQASFRTARRMRARLTWLGDYGATVEADRVDDPGHNGLAFSWSTLLGLLWLWQLVLYLAQENLESRAMGLPLPGLGAMSGVHAVAPAIHLAVAVVVAAAVWVLRRRVTHLAAEIRRVVGLLAARRLRAVVTISRRITRWWTPTERWGVQLWVRPPPAPAAV